MLRAYEIEKQDFYQMFSQLASSVKHYLSDQRKNVVHAMLAVYIAMTTYFIYMLYQGQKNFQKETRESDDFSDSLNFPHLQDFGYAIIAAVVLGYIRHLSHPYFRRLAPHVLSEAKGKDADRCDRFASCGFKFGYFILAVGYGWNLMKDENWLPSVLGGNADSKTLNCFKGYPMHFVSDSMRAYYMVQLGYHIQSLVFQVFWTTARSDYVEMFIHHTATVTLMGTSWLYNYHRIGALVLFTHDIADINTYLIKMVCDTSHFALVVFCHLFMMCVWFYTRLFVYPMHILQATTFESTEYVPQHEYAHNSLAVLLWVLLCLHIYWFGLFVKMIKDAFSSGVTEDKQQQVGEHNFKNAAEKAAATRRA